MDQEKIRDHTLILLRRLGLSTNDYDRIEWLMVEVSQLILDYTNRDTMLDSFYFYASKLAVIAWNREGSEGESSRSEGGVSQSFIEDIPADVKSGLNRYRLGKVVSFYAPKET